MELTICICAVILTNGSAGITSGLISHVSNALRSACTVVYELQFRNWANAIEKVLKLSVMLKLRLSRSSYIEIAFRQVVVYVVDTQFRACWCAE